MPKTQIVLYAYVEVCKKKKRGLYLDSEMSIYEHLSFCGFF